MSREQWLVGFHVLGALLFVGGAVATGIVQTAALLRTRPSEIAVLLRLTRPAVLAVGVGSLLTLGLGIWLAHDLGYGLGQTWLAAALALWVASLALGGYGGRSARHARYLAEQLAGSGDEPSPELRRAVGSPVALAINYASLAAVLAVVGLMIWKPGA